MVVIMYLKGSFQQDGAFCGSFCNLKSLSLHLPESLECNEFVT